jgi:hypothetical protein
VVRARVPLSARFDLARGGRWTSLSGGGREWLWSRHDPARRTVAPGSAFVDAGGVEECVPTVRGLPDHGDAWSRPWTGTPAGSTVTCDDFSLTRTIADEGGAVVATYRLSAEPGFRFVWAAHALLDLGERARLVAPPGTPVRVFAEAAPLLGPAWPPGATHLDGAWPDPYGLELDRFGPDDGTAVGAVLRCAAARVEDEDDVLDVRLEAPPEVPVGIALWRNLGGFPEHAPYRSVGVEPMLGAVFDVAEAGPGDAAVVPVSGELSWRLSMAAERTNR